MIRGLQPGTLGFKAHPGPLRLSTNRKEKSPGLTCVSEFVKGVKTELEAA